MPRAAAAPILRSVSRLRDASGQAAVELVVLLPLLVALALALWQAILVGRAAWSSAAAARAAARAQAVGAPPLAAARRALPVGLRAGLRVRPDGDGVTVGVRVPLVLTRLRDGTVEGRAALPPQR